MFDSRHLRKRGRVSRERKARIMRFTEQADLAFCLTISTGIERDTLLHLMGRDDVLPLPQTFDDFVENRDQNNHRGLINVFEEGDFVITLENSGFMGVLTHTISRMQILTAKGPAHYASIYRSPKVGAGYKYVEIQDGLLLANFNPLLDEAPLAVDQFFPQEAIVDITKAMIEALEYRMEIKVQPKWLEQPTDTYIIDYKTIRV